MPWALGIIKSFKNLILPALARMRDFAVYKSNCRLQRLNCICIHTLIKHKINWVRVGVRVMFRLRVRSRINPNHNPNPNPNQSKLKTFVCKMFSSSQRTLRKLTRTPPAFANGCFVLAECWLLFAKNTRRTVSECRRSSRQTIVRQLYCSKFCHGCIHL
jgi:hypothetical protein